MNKYQKVEQLVENAYLNSDDSFAQWMWENHVPVVAKKTKELSSKYNANLDLAVAGALLHDFGDAFANRFDSNHESVSESEARKVMLKAGYSENEIKEILQDVIAPHSCKKGDELPKTKEAKILATADALAHLTTDFYIQFTWKHIPEGKTYEEFLTWATEKLDRDFNRKIFFDEIKDEVRYRYEALSELFVKK